jgi:hypothetical protein
VLTIELSQNEKLAGRHFREISNQTLADLNEERPPTYFVLVHWAQYRHLCAARRNISTAMELKEIYKLSPEYVICENRFGDVFALPSSSSVPADSHVVDRIEPGMFAFWYKEGHCRGCGQTGRSKLGICKPAAMRPPIEGRVARRSG